jgi:hypothetical protein
MLYVLQNGGSLGRTALPHFLHPSRPIAWLFVPVRLEIQLILHALLDEKSSSKEDAEFVDYGELDIHIFEEDGQQRNIYHDFNQDLDVEMMIRSRRTTNTITTRLTTIRSAIRTLVDDKKSPNEEEVQAR